MKTTRIFLLLTFLTSAGIAIETITGSNAARSNGGGAPQHTSCDGCHLGPAVNSDLNGLASIEITGDPQYYVPGRTYQVKVTGTYPGRTKFGFSLRAENASFGTAGQFATGGNTSMQNLGSYITHTASGTSAPTGTKAWTMNWVAPNSNVGKITFELFVNATNADGSNSGDKVFSAVKSLNFSATSTHEKISSNTTQLYPQPANGLVHISSLDMKGKQVHLELFTLSGQQLAVLLHEEVQDNTAQLNIAEFPTGIYLIQGSIGNEIFCQKLIIQ